MAKRGKSINVFLMDGDASGRIKVSISNWVGVAYKIPRSKLSLCKERDDLSQSSVYFLFGNNEAGDNAAYIGQAGIRKNGGGILVRLLEHDKNPDKNFFTEAVVFTTSNNSFGPTELSYLENRFCNMAISAGRYIIKNANDPSPGNITEEKESELEEFADYAELILGVLGYKIFSPVEVTPISHNEPSPQPTETQQTSVTPTKTPEKKIGQFAKQDVAKLLSHPNFPRDEITKLLSLDYCKSIFKKKVYYPVLLEWKEGEDRAQISLKSGNYRYYSDVVINCEGRRYLLSSQWYADAFPYLLEWYEKMSQRVTE